VPQHAKRWHFERTPRAEKALRSLDKPVLRRIRAYLDKVAQLENPRNRGKPLKANKAGLWAYRVEDYRVVCDIHDDTLVILVVDAGHRKNIYDD